MLNNIFKNASQALTGEAFIDLLASYAATH